MKTKGLKTITVTSQNAINYGAVLQAYALQKKLSELGIDDEIIDIKSHDKVYLKKIRLGRTLPSDIYNNIINLFYIGKTKKRVCRFKGFVKNNIKTTRCYITDKEVVDEPCIADVYITGGDQMFNTHKGVNPVSFLEFGSDNTRRISYSTSMGVATVDERYLGEFVSAIEKYSFLSVREINMKNYISKLCSVPCFVNIDPTFLLKGKAWENMASKSKVPQKTLDKKYILVYALLYNPLLNDAVKKLKKETGLEVIAINPSSRCFVKADVIIRDAGPLEFLSLFKNAQYILTTSFHGTCFSIIFQKKFFSFIRKVGETRINNILNTLNLSDKIITDLNQIKLDEILYDDVNNIIRDERAKANEYLTKAIGI